jgi:hypothetical protein
MGDSRDDGKVSAPPPARRGRGRPRKDGQPVKKHTIHDKGHFEDIRLRRELAGIIHKQFRILDKDVLEAERRLKDLMETADAEFYRVTREINEALGKESDGRSRNRAGKFVRSETPEDAAPTPAPVEAHGEIDPLDDLPPVEMPPVSLSPEQVSPTPSLPEIETPPEPKLDAKPKPDSKPISQRGKLTLKAFRKTAP